MLVFDLNGRREVNALLVFDFNGRREVDVMLVFAIYFLIVFTGLGILATSKI